MFTISIHHDISNWSNEHYNLAYIQMHSAVRCILGILKGQEVPGMVEWCCTVKYCILWYFDLSSTQPSTQNQPARWETAHQNLNCNLTNTQNALKYHTAVQSWLGKLHSIKNLVCFIPTVSSQIDIHVNAKVETTT